MNLVQDIALFRKLVGGLNIVKSEDVKQFDKPYLFTNEYLYEYLGQLNLLNKKVLTTGSSGDQILYSLLFGAREVVCYDINPFDRYIFDYKTACIKTFDLATLKRLLINSKNCTIAFENLLNQDMYNKICHNLTPISKRFWAEALKYCSKERIDLICQKDGNALGKCEYLNNKVVYNELKQILMAGNYKVQFITTDVRKVFSKLSSDDKFDVILLSNILNYCWLWDSNDPTEKMNSRVLGLWPQFHAPAVVKNNSGFTQFKAVVDGLAHYHLAPGGTIQVGYRYGVTPTALNWLTQILDPTKLEVLQLSASNSVIFYTPKPILADANTHALVPVDDEPTMGNY